MGFFILFVTSVAQAAANHIGAAKAEEAHSAFQTLQVNPLTVKFPREQAGEEEAMLVPAELPADFSRAQEHGGVEEKLKLHAVLAVQDSGARCPHVDGI